MTFPLAFAIGFSVASIPGPTIILVATETLRKGAKSGLATMAAPILLDAVIMLPLGLVLQSSIFSGKGALFLGFVGAAFLVWLGTQSIQAGAKGRRDKGLKGSREMELTLNPLNPSSLNPFFKGVLTHLTSPYPYLYWGTAGATFVRQGFQSGGVWAAAVFPLGFWLGAGVFTLIVIYLVARTKRLLPPRLEPHLHRLSGVLLIGSGIFLAVRLWQGLF